MRVVIGILGVTLASGTAAFAAGPYKAGWTAADLDQAAEGCTGELVKGAWANTKKEQHVDPDMEMTPEIRKQLEPQIKAMRGLCDCAVKEAAKQYDKSDANKPDTELVRFTADVIKSGKCKLAQ